MDIGRRPYTTKARFFDDDDRQTDIEWYVTPRARGTVKVPSKFASLDWSSFPWLAKGVGEVYGAERKYNGKWALRLPAVPHPCGTPRQVARGIEFDPTVNICYDAQTIPFCCVGPVNKLPWNYVDSAFPVTIGPWIEARTTDPAEGGFTGFVVFEVAATPGVPVWVQVCEVDPYPWPPLSYLYFDLATYTTGLSWDAVNVINFPLPGTLPKTGSITPTGIQTVQFAFNIEYGLALSRGPCGIPFRFRFGTGPIPSACSP